MIAAVNRVTPLVQTAAIRLERFDHAPGEAHRDPEREHAVGHAVNFVVAGSFRVRTVGAWRDASPATLFVTRPGLEFSCAHDVEHPDDACLTVSFAEPAVEDASLRGDAAPVRSLTNHQAFLRRTLASCAPGDEARAEALAGALWWSLTPGVSRHPLFPATRLAWYAVRVDRAKEMMAARYAEPLALSTLAREVGMSVFHFARVFAELEGCPPHRYLADLRLSRAHAQLRSGARVADACFCAGFGSLSHFVATFRRRYGRTPSDVRRGTSASTRAAPTHPTR